MSVGNFFFFSKFSSTWLKKWTSEFLLFTFFIGKHFVTFFLIFWNFFFFFVVFLVERESERTRRALTYEKTEVWTDDGGVMLFRCCCAIAAGAATTSGTINEDSSESGLVATVANFPPAPSSSFLWPPTIPLKEDPKKAVFLTKKLLGNCVTLPTKIFNFSIGYLADILARK